MNREDLLAFQPSAIAEKEQGEYLLDYFIEDLTFDRHSQRKIYYISDIHLDHKLKRKKYFWQNNEKLIEKQIEDIVVDLCSDVDLNHMPFLLIAGDTSFDYSINKLFYTKLAEVWGGSRIVVVLGNHELWGYNSVEDAKLQYKELFNNLKINFLDNELIAIHKYGGVVKMLIDPFDLSNDGLAELCLKNSFCIFGGTGYASLNNEYNATKGLYRNAIDTIEKEKTYAQKFVDRYNKLLEVAGLNDNIIILTHMPMKDWSNELHNPTWKYVNGHTHKNQLYCTDTKMVYADNQIGYYNSNISLKYFFTEKAYDIFKHYSDGIYVISTTEYSAFMYGMNVQMDFKGKGIETIYMLKRDGLYLFLCKKASNGKLYLLEGGKRRVLYVQDINYYFDNMLYYVNRINEPYEKYYNFLKNISAFVKKIGGDGTIHGAIVDIDYNNHIYINPNDGKITFYFATSIQDKYVYNDFKHLLEKRLPKLLPNYIKAITSDDVSVQSLISSVNNGVYSLPQFVRSTDIYKTSNLLKKFQYVKDKNILRVWNDDIINNDKKRLTK